MGHDAAAAHVLSSWKFPTPFVEAVAWHHRPTEGQPLAAAVRLGDLLAHLSEDYQPPRPPPVVDDADLSPEALERDEPVEPAAAPAFDPEIVEQLLQAGIEADAHEDLVASTFDRAAEILSTLPI
jgi:hypothetical protein